MHVMLTLGRSAPSGSGDSVYLDHLRHEVSRGRQRISLSPRTFTLTAAIIVSPCNLSGRELIDIVYGEALPDGGPIWAACCIRTFAMEARTKLRPLGITFYGHRDSGYRLYDLWDPKTAAAPPTGGP